MMLSLPCCTLRPVTTIQEEQQYPEAGMSSAPTFTKYEQLSDENLDDWVERGFGEFDDVEESPVAYTFVGDEGSDDAAAVVEKEHKGMLCV